MDVGAYDTCTHNCTYCYAVSSQDYANKRMTKHDPKAPLITGYPRGDEIINDRTRASQKEQQLTLFDRF